MKQKHEKWRKRTKKIISCFVYCTSQSVSVIYVVLFDMLQLYRDKSYNIYLFIDAKIKFWKISPFFNDTGHWCTNSRTDYNNKITYNERQTIIAVYVINWAQTNIKKNGKENNKNKNKIKSLVIKAEIGVSVASSHMRNHSDRLN